MREVTFPSASPATFWDAASSARAAPPVEGRGQSFWPDPPAAGRLPAVVILPGLGGIAEFREPRYGELLARAGYAALAPDTFGARGAGSASLLRRALTVTEAMMVADAYAALAHLAADPRIDPARIAVIGFSYGGFAALLCAYAQIARLYAGERGPRFAAHVSYYGCSIARLTDPATTGAPVRILVGDRDRNVDLEHVRAIRDDLRRGGSRADLDVYPGVCHQWDGVDAEPRRVRPSPHRLRLEIRPDYRVKDTRTGLVVTGAGSRAAVLLANVDPRGYDMLRDEAALARSDRTLLGFLGEALAGTPQTASA